MISLAEHDCLLSFNKICSYRSFLYDCIYFLCSYYTIPKAGIAVVNFGLRISPNMALINFHESLTHHILFEFECLRLCGSNKNILDYYIMYFRHVFKIVTNNIHCNNLISSSTKFSTV